MGEGRHLAPVVAVLRSVRHAGKYLDPAPGALASGAGSVLSSWVTTFITVAHATLVAVAHTTLLAVAHATLLAVAAATLLPAAPVTLHAQTIGPANGSLVIAGGGGLGGTGIIERFIELAGGPDAPIVVIPTAGAADDCYLDPDVPDCSYDSSYPGLRGFREAGALNLTVLHTRDRRVADSEAFVRPIADGQGVWFPGGRQWKLADSYLDTRVHAELRALLDRGGVIGGSSAGAHIQGDYLNVSRSPDEEFASRRLPRDKWRQGFAFVRNVAIDVHILARDRQFDMIGVIEAHPDQLGVALDEQAAIVVQGDEFEVIGTSYALVYDNTSWLPPDGEDTFRTVGGPFFFLRPGDRYDLASRQAQRPTRTEQPVQRVRRRGPGG